MKPVTIGAQWEATHGTNIAISPESAHDGGQAWAGFPQGAYVYALSFQPSVKTPPPYELLAAVIYQNGADATAWLRTFLNGAVTTLSKEITLPQPIRIVPGGKVWLFMQGWTGPFSGTYPDPLVAISVEAHLTMWVDGGAAVELPAG